MLRPLFGSFPVLWFPSLQIVQNGACNVEELGVGGGGSRLGCGFFFCHNSVPLPRGPSLEMLRMQRQRAEASEGKIAKLPKLRAATAKGPTEKHTHTHFYTLPTLNYES